jgi:ATP-binding cassette, subfamily C (CFTR/MRP), member 1
MLSTDTTRLDFALGFCHQVWVSPLMVRSHFLTARTRKADCLKIILALGLLIGNLGVSALVAVAVLVLGSPVQAIIVKLMFKVRMSGMLITDSRVRLLQEVVQGIRLVKIYAWVCIRFQLLSCVDPDILEGNSIWS